MGINNSANDFGFLTDVMHFLRNRDEVSKVSGTGKQRKIKRTLPIIGIILLFLVFVPIKFILALQSFGGIRGSKTRGATPKQYLSAITPLLPSIRTELNGIPLKSVRDEIAEGKEIPVAAAESIGDASSQDSNTTSPLLLNFNASVSIGSLLIQMQKKEAELRLLNSSSSLLLSEDQALKLDATGSNTSSIKTRPNSRAPKETEAPSRKSDLFAWIRKQEGDASSTGSAARKDADLSFIDDEIASELDSSVAIRITNSVKDLTILEPPDVSRIKPKSRMEGTMRPQEKGTYNRSRAGEKLSSSTTVEGDIGASDQDFQSLSRAEHYTGRIGMDMRHLAVTIASCVDSVEEWQHFCQQSTGGLKPLIECIREGAESLREGGQSSTPSRSEDRHLVSPTGTTYGSGLNRREKKIQVASRACQVLRDLCALSQELASIVTDGLLRADAAYKSKGEHTLMDDLCTILRQADDFFDAQQYASDEEVQSAKPRLFPGRRKRKTSSRGIFRGRREARLQIKLYVTQLLLAMTCASDSAVDAIRTTEGLKDVLLVHSSYHRKERRRRWIRYPGEKLKSIWLAKRKTRIKNSSKASAIENPEEKRRQPFIEAASLQNNLNGKIKGIANQILAAIGYNEWVPKIPGQKGLRILCLDGGGSRGMTSVVAMKCLVDSLGGMEVADCFDLVVGTSTGAIIAFLVGLNRETSEQAVERYDSLIEKIFTKSAFSTPMLLFTTASYDESRFMDVLSDILGDNTMLDSRANAAVPYVFAVTSKMSSNPTHVALFRNYNYNGGEQPDPFVIHPEDARENLDMSLRNEAKIIRQSTYPKKEGIYQPAPGTITPDNGSRHPGSFRVLQKYALRASTAAPTVFKPVLMGGEMYCDGGIVASNPSAIAIHEARTIFPDVPIELVVSIGTGGFTEQKSEPRIGWDGIIGQIILSATDGEQIHHILEDVLGDGTTAKGKSSVSNTSYMRFNPILGMPDEFPIDVTDPDKLRRIKEITRDYMEEPEQQRKLEILSDILKGRRTSRFRTWFWGRKG